MAGKVIKEIIIALLICLLAMLLFAVILYQYLPSRKVVPEVSQYKAPDTVSEQLTDNVENKNDQIILTYEVTASDLNGYKKANDYVPGKDNPFSNVTDDPTATIDPNNPNAGRSKTETGKNTIGGGGNNTKTPITTK